MCVGYPFSNDQSVSDFENDSIAYSLYSPLTGADNMNPMPTIPDPGPYIPVNWLSPYSFADPIGGVPLAIDPITGLLTATPSTLGSFVYGIKIEEYRNGIKISETIRDLSVAVVNPVGVNDFSKTVSIRVSEESRSIKRIELVNCIEPATLTLYDLHGRELLTSRFNSSTTIDLSGISQGTYFIQVTVGGDKFAAKIFIAQ
jgi:hypothetical protein